MANFRDFLDFQPMLECVKDKKKSARYIYQYMFARCMEMFQYKRLPKSLEAYIFDKWTMNNGISCITADDKGAPRVFFGNLGGEYDVYYRPKKFIIANPHLGAQGFYKEAIVFGEDEEHDGVLMRNDTGWIGLFPMISRYSILMAENYVTLRVADIMLRIIAMLSAPTDKERAAAEAFLAKIEKGELGAIGDNPFFDGIKMQSPPSNNGSYLTQFIELQQYLLGSFYNEIGLSANYNMKREAIGKGESTLDQDALLPLCENMLKCRQEDFNKVNEMFGTDIEVNFSSSWLENILEAKISFLARATEAGLSMPTSSSPDPLVDLEGGEVGSSGDELGHVGSTSNDKENVEGDEKTDETERTDGDESADENAGAGDSSVPEGSDSDESSGNGDESEDEIDGLDSIDNPLDNLEEVLDDALSQLKAEKEKVEFDMNGGGSDEFGGDDSGEKTSDD